MVRKLINLGSIAFGGYVTYKLFMGAMRFALTLSTVGQG